jgi:hypothetical protein
MARARFAGARDSAGREPGGSAAIERADVSGGVPPLQLKPAARCFQRHGQGNNLPVVLVGNNRRNPASDRRGAVNVLIWRLRLMKMFGPLSRAVALAGLIIASPLPVMTVEAAQADVDLLKTYVGDWKGRGTLVGADSESVVCRMSLTPGNQQKINYAGRCALAGTQLSVNGTIAYNDAARQYEAAMTSNVTFSGIAVGQRRGDGIVFNLHERDKDEQGNDMTISAAITLAKAKITVDFQVVFTKSGDTIRAQVPFSKG